MIRYYLPEYSETPEDAREIKDKTHRFDAEFPSFTAEKAAEEYHSFHGGWESSWPLTFVLIDEANKELGRFSVDRESVPQFSATEIKEKP